MKHAAKHGETFHLWRHPHNAGMHTDLCSVISITEKDNYSTYPLLQMCVGVEDEIKAIHDVMNGTRKTVTNDLPSLIFFHPTLAEYLRRRRKYGVK